MMSLEGPYLSAVIARMADPKYNLAAYGVAFSLAIIMEAPIIMIMSATTALVKGKESFARLKKFTYSANLMITLAMLIFIIPPIFYFVAETLIGLPERVAYLTHISVIILLPWPAAIGYRRFYQGVLIKYNLTRRVAYGTIIRLVSMTVTALVLYFFFDIEGAFVGAAALTAGVVSEGAASKLMALNIVRKIQHVPAEEDEVLSYKEIFNFYYPLALTSMIGLGIHPMVTFLVGQSRMSLESLAVLPVINSLVFIFRSFGLSYQEVGIALIGNSVEKYRKIRNFAFFVGILTVCFLGLISFTPVSEFWFHVVSGLSVELTEFARAPLMVLTVLPGLTFLISFQRTILVTTRKTKPVTMATTIEVIGIVSVLFLLINYADFVGAMAAAVGFLVGRISANIYLMKPYIDSVKLIGKKEE